MKTSGILNLIVGPVGAGKTTFARQRVTRMGGVLLDPDAWMVRLYGKDTRPRDDVLAWYLECRERCRALLWDTTLNIVASGADVVVELGLVSAVEREAYYTKVCDEGVKLTVYLVDAPCDVRRQRVAQRNRSAGEHTQIVPMDFFERASDMWESPSEAERRAVVMVEI